MSSSVIESKQLIISFQSSLNLGSSAIARPNLWECFSVSNQSPVFVVSSFHWDIRYFGIMDTGGGADINHLGLRELVGLVRRSGQRKCVDRVGLLRSTADVEEVVQTGLDVVFGGQQP